MTTLTGFVTICATALGDAAHSVWGVETLQRWILQAIRQYSAMLPRVMTAEITCTANVRQYDLPTNFIAAQSIEYPNGQDPKEFITRRDSNRADFWQSIGYYDVLHHSDAADPPEIIISEKPSAGQKITVIYDAMHDHALGANDVLTIPAQGEDLLLAYVEYLAYKERAAYWASYSGETIAGPFKERFEQAKQFQSLADSAWARWVTGTEKARRPAAASNTVVWRADEFDPVY